LPREITVSCGIRLVLIPAGEFLMGAPPGEHQAGEDERPQRRVTISRPFYMSVTPVTQQQYEAVVGTNPSRFTKAAGGGPLHPVEQVSWEDAVAFCRRLSQLPAERRAGRVFTLPTEAQWEYACRAGRGTAFALGDSLSAGQANFDGTRPYGAGKEGAYPQRTTKVGSYPANAWGLFDVHGNVWEWCADWYDEDYYASGPAVDPAGPERGTARVLRGGSWNNSGHVCRAAKRNRYRPDFKNDNIGFRVVLVVPR
jgi:formylglycine-generating enzyme required for sulfatase activity